MTYGFVKCYLGSMNASRDKVFGLRAANPAITAAEMARQLGVSRERVRQLLVSLDLPTKTANSRIRVPFAGPYRREYLCWWNMIDRCANPRNPTFRHYGGRGIIVCKRWAESFDSFLSDMGRRPSSQHSIGRIDNDGNYELSNCRWETRSQQAHNMRSNKLTRAIVNEIKKCHANGQSQVSLAKRFGVTQTCVSAIVRGRSWK